MHAPPKDAALSSNTPTAKTSNIPCPPILLHQAPLHTTEPFPQPSEISLPIPPASAWPPAPPSRADDASSYYPACVGPLPLSLPPRTTEPTFESLCASPPPPPSPESASLLAATTTKPAIAGQIRISLSSVQFVQLFFRMLPGYLQWSGSINLLRTKI